MMSGLCASGIHAFCFGGFSPQQYVWIVCDCPHHKEMLGEEDWKRIRENLNKAAVNEEEVHVREHEIGVLLEGAYRVEIVRQDGPDGEVDGFRLIGLESKAIYVPAEMVHRLSAILTAEVEKQRE